MPAFQDPEIYRDILNGLQIGVSVLDMEKKIVFWSDGAEHISGYSRIDVLGHPCTANILLHCNQSCCDLCSDRCPIATALHDARALEAISFIHHKSGHRVPVHCWAIPLRDKHGSIIGVIQTFEGEVAVNGPDPNEETMKQRGWLDAATGLPNQAMMQSHLRETLGSFTELQVPFGVVCVELPELRQLRARYGQGASAAALEVLARTLRNTVWPTDFVGCWSESRFLVILCGCGEDALQAVTARIGRMMSTATIAWWGEELPVKTAIGSAGALPGDSMESLLQRLLRGLGGNPEREAATQAAGAPAGC